MSFLEEQAYLDELKLDTDRQYYGYYDDLFPDENLPSRELEELEFDDVVMGSEGFTTTVIEAYIYFASNVGGSGGTAYHPPDLDELEDYIREQYEEEINMVAEAHDYSDEKYKDSDEYQKKFDEIVNDLQEDFMNYISPNLSVWICEVLDTIGYTYLLRTIGENKYGSVIEIDHIENSSAEPIFDFDITNAFEYKGGNYERSVREGYSNLLRMYMA